MTVEVEFGSVEEAEDFTPPGWFGQEITGREELSNRSLALKTQKLRQQIKNE